MRDSIIYLLAVLPKSKRKSTTPNRGKEFSNHREVTQYLDKISFYFADPYFPWQRGTNENTNVLLGECFPKKIHQYLYRKLNKCPRKCFDYKTPYEPFFGKVFHLICHSRFKKIVSS